MLSLTSVGPIRPHRRETGRCQFATEPWQLDAARKIRHQVFVVEQGVFQVHDRDESDADALTIIAVHKSRSRNEEHQRFSNASTKGETPVIGTVRIHRDTVPGVWFGSRLALLPNHRGAAVMAASLIRKAVASALVIGCDRFLAKIQPQNRRLFERLGWVVLDDIFLMQRRHLLVEAQLNYFQPDDWLDSVEIQWARFLGHQQVLVATHDDQQTNALAVTPWETT